MFGNLSRNEIYRFNVIFSTIMMAFALGQFIQAEGEILSITLLGIYFPLQIKFQTLISIAVLGLTAGGCYWVFKNHPHAEDHNILPHILLPSLTAWSINFLLNAISSNSLLWVVYVFSGILIGIITLAEYQSIDENADFRSITLTGLNFISYILFFLLLITTHAIDQRLFYKLPTLAIAGGLLSVRNLHYSISSKNQIPMIIVTIIFITQTASAFHYLNISSIDYALLVIGPIFAFLYFFEKFSITNNFKREIYFSLSGMMVIWGAAFWI